MHLGSIHLSNSSAATVLKSAPRVPAILTVRGYVTLLGSLGLPIICLRSGAPPRPPESLGPNHRSSLFQYWDKKAGIAVELNEL